MDNLYIQFHIPRTGGTYFSKKIGNYLDRTNDRYLKHYNFNSELGRTIYAYNRIPHIQYRTKEQQQKLRIVTGHCTWAGLADYLKIDRNIRYITTVRNPVERILSSFNYRHMLSNLEQNLETFSTQLPLMSNRSVYNKVSAADFDTLYEYYTHSIYEHNLQCKWLIKSFFTHVTQSDQWVKHSHYYSKFFHMPELEVLPEFAIMDDKDWWEFVQEVLPEMWWLGVTENLDSDLKDFCEIANIEYIDNNVDNNSSTTHQYWTLDDVMQQPDINKLISAECHDFKLYEHAKKLERPF